MTDIQLPSNPCLERKRDDYQHSPESSADDGPSDMRIMALPPSLTQAGSWSNDLYSIDVAEFQQHEKHRLTSYNDDNYEPAAKKQEVGHSYNHHDDADSANATKERKKPGRKPIVDEPTTKRKAQNRQAQRAFRERKENHVKTLETRVAELEAQTETQATENELLKRKLAFLQTKMLSERADQQQQLDFSPPSASKDFTFEMASPLESYGSRASPSGPGLAHVTSDSGYSTSNGRALSATASSSNTSQFGGDRLRTDSIHSLSYDRPHLQQQVSNGSSCPSLHSGSSPSASPASACEQDFCAASLPFFGNETVQAISADSLDPQNVILRANEMFAQQQKSQHAGDQQQQPSSLDFGAATDPLVFDDPFVLQGGPSAQTPNFSFDSMQYRESSAVPPDFADLFAPLEGIAELPEDPLAGTSWASNPQPIPVGGCPSAREEDPNFLRAPAMQLLANMDREPGAATTKSDELVAYLTAFNQKMTSDKATLASQGIRQEELFDKEEHDKMCNVVYDKILTHPKFESFDIDELCSDMSKHAKCTEAHEELLAVAPEKRLAHKAAWMDMLLDHHASKQREKLELQAQQDAFAMFCPKD